MNLLHQDIRDRTYYSQPWIQTEEPRQLTGNQDVLFLVDTLSHCPVVSVMEMMAVCALCLVTGSVHRRAFSLIRGKIHIFIVSGGGSALWIYQS
jgi:hypothetical protein